MVRMTMLDEKLYGSSDPSVLLPSFTSFKVLQSTWFREAQVSGNS